MRIKGTKILILVACWCCALKVQAQCLIVGPTSIHLEQTASNWQTTILTGFVLSGNVGFTYYRVDIPPLEIGLPRYTGPDDDRQWIMTRRAVKDIAWAADRAAYLCAQRWIIDRSYYSQKATVVRDFKQAFLLNLQTRLPACRLKYEGKNSPRIDRSVIRFVQISYGAYLVHLGI